MATYVYILIVIFAALTIVELFRKRFIGALLWVVIGVLAFLVTESILKPIRFTEQRDQRYAQVIKQLEVIRDAQVLYRTVNGKFASNFDQLDSFLDTGKVYITSTREEIVKEYDAVFRIDKMVEKKFIDTIDVVVANKQLATTSPRFASFTKKNNGDYKVMKFVPNTDKTQIFQIAASAIDRGQNKVPTFEVSVTKDIVLAGEPEELIAQEKEAIVGVKGDVIKIGDIAAPSTEGNWGKVAE